ncbi:ethylmalonyl-CoA decarboxylase-like isoform X1 [Zootermopsis nevadensis]|nr:ethylmalonyl-CoA decarboxylase-like isoform X1 [Zootermopsis nevadensis]XP_021922118.1 ethylmalonyl-CoA decarboxylase-like isoform X1 [Zootermopsis nevadensis]
MWSILDYIFKRKPVPTILKQYNSINYYNGPEIATAEIRKRLLQSRGGCVDVVKNEDTGIATLCLNNPERRNAISGSMMVDLADAVDMLESWDTGKGLIIYGHGHTFCSGGDLNMARMFSNPDDGFLMAVFMQRVLGQLEKLPLISVALIEGTGALGGGSELAMACDFRLLTSDTGGIGHVHSRMGITPAWGGCTRLVRTIGYTKALNLLTTGCRLSGEEALHIGLADSIVDTKNALTEASEWLKVRTNCDVAVLKSLKTMAHNAKEMSYQESLAEEKRLFAPLWGGPANRAALTQNIKHK